jgi:hypothetical protein
MCPRLTFHGSIIPQPCLGILGDRRSFGIINERALSECNAGLQLTRDFFSDFSARFTNPYPFCLALLLMVYKDLLGGLLPRLIDKVRLHAKGQLPPPTPPIFLGQITRWMDDS